MLLRVGEVAERMRVRPATVYKWLRLGWLGSVRFGRIVRVPADGLEAFIAAGGSQRPAGGDSEGRAARA